MKSQVQSTKDGAKVSNQGKAVNQHAYSASTQIPSFGLHTNTGGPQPQEYQHYEKNVLYKKLKARAAESQNFGSAGALSLSAFQHDSNKLGESQQRMKGVQNSGRPFAVNSHTFVYGRSFENDSFPNKVHRETLPHLNLQHAKNEPKKQPPRLRQPTNVNKIQVVKKQFVYTRGDSVRSNATAAPGQRVVHLLRDEVNFADTARQSVGNPGSNLVRKVQTPQVFTGKTSVKRSTRVNRENVSNNIYYADYNPFLQSVRNNNYKVTNNPPSEYTPSKMIYQDCQNEVDSIDMRVMESEIAEDFKSSDKDELNFSFANDDYGTAPAQTTQNAPTQPELKPPEFVSKYGIKKIVPPPRTGQNSNLRQMTNISRGTEHSIMTVNSSQYAMRREKVPIKQRQSEVKKVVPRQSVPDPKPAQNSIYFNPFHQTQQVPQSHRGLPGSSNAVPLYGSVSPEKKRTGTVQTQNEDSAAKNTRFTQFQASMQHKYM